MAHPGIEQFKAGFGGRELRYVGAWELVVNPLVHGAVGGARRLRVAHGPAVAGRERASSGREGDAREPR